MAKSDLLGSVKDAEIFWGRKNTGTFLGCEKRTKGFLGIKYEPLSDTPVIKICEWDPW